MNPLIMNYDDLLSYHKPRDEIEAHIMSQLRDVIGEGEPLRDLLYNFGLPHDDNPKLESLLKEGFDKSDKYDKIDKLLGDLALPSDPDELRTALETLDAKADEVDALREILALL